MKIENYKTGVAITIAFTAYLIINLTWKYLGSYGTQLYFDFKEIMVLAALYGCRRLFKNKSLSFFILMDYFFNLQIFVVIIELFFDATVYDIAQLTGVIVSLIIAIIRYTKNKSTITNM